MVVQIEQDSITKAVDWTRSFLESSDKNAQGRSKDLLITELDQFIKIPRLIKDWSRWYKDFASRWLISIFKQALIPLPKSRDLNDLLIFGSRLSHSYATVLLPLDMLSDELGSIHNTQFKMFITGKLHPYFVDELEPIFTSYFRNYLDSLFAEDFDFDSYKAIQTVIADLSAYNLQRIVEKGSMESICAIVDSTIKLEYPTDESLLNFYKEKLESKLIIALRTIFVNDERKLHSWKLRIEFHVNETIRGLLLDNIFEIIRDYPESLNAVKDLRECVDKTGSYDNLIHCVKKSFDNRLLIIDAKTSSIISFYLLSYNCLEILTKDCSQRDIILDSIKAYLRKRPDSAEQVLLKVFDPYINEAENLREDEMKLLLEIFPTSSILAKTHRQLLSHRLVERLDFECDDDIRQGEILKERLGEQDMLLSEVMMKDFADSRRITNAYHASEEGNVNFSALVVSKHYWPQSTTEELNFKVPGMILKSMSEFFRVFCGLFNTRELFWLPGSGLVNVNVCLNAQDPISFVVTPLQASILFLIQERDEINLDELTTLLECRKDSVRKECQFWESKKVLSLFGNMVVVNDYSNIGKYTRIDNEDTDFAADEEIGTEGSAFDMEIEKIWPFLQGMLQNLGSLESSRIHMTLGMFNSDLFCYTMKPEELNSLLDSLVLKEKLIFESGKFKLKRHGE